MFKERKRELSVLNKAYLKDRFEFFVIYGRRRIGKSSLIKEFVKDKPNIFFTAQNNNIMINLQNLSKEISRFKNTNKRALYSTFQDALEELFELSLSKQFVLVIDEFPYIAKKMPELSSILQILIDKYHESSKLFLILCGSSISYIEEEVLAYKAPLFGRRTGQMKLSPLSFKEVIHYYPELDNETKALVYGAYGGTPFYLNQFDPMLGFKENIVSAFLEPNTLLFDEPENLMRQELRETSNYNAVLSLVALGNTRVNDIATKAGLGTNKIAYYLKNLIEMDLIQKEYPYSENRSKSALYKIKDNMFRFWYRFVETNSNWIHQDLGEVAYDEIEPLLSEYMGSVFEAICQEYLWELLRKGKSPIKFRSIGRWWGTNKATKQQEEIDIIGEQDKATALFAECKWTNKKVDSHVLNNLIRRSRIFNYLNNGYYLFSKSGFTDECIEIANQNPNIHLITFDEIMQELQN